MNKLDKKRKSAKDEPTAKSPKKRKAQEEDEEEMSALKLDRAQVNKEVFGILGDLMASKFDVQKQGRLNELIKVLNYDTDEAQRTATSAYALRRLVRCTGSDDRMAVALSASYVNAIVCHVHNNDPILLLEILKRELPVKTENKGKDDSLAVVGHLLTTRSLLKSHHFDVRTTELLAAIYPILVTHLKGREYLVTMSCRILTESFSLINPDIFKSIAWPLLQAKLCKPITKQTLRTSDLLLAVHLSFPLTLTLKELKSVLWPNQRPEYAQLFDLYLENTDTMSSEEADAEHLGQFLASSPVEEGLLTAWKQHIASKWPLKRTAAKCHIIRTLSQIVLFYDESKHSGDDQLEHLFNSSFIADLLKDLSELTRLAKLKKLKSKSQELRDCFHEFEMDLITSFKTLLTKPTKLKVIMSLLEQKPDLDDIMQTPNLTHKLFKQLDEQGQTIVYEFYRKHATLEDPTISNWQRQYYLNQMYHLQLLLKRSSDIDFLLPAAIYHLDAKHKPCAREQASPFSRQLASRCEELLFSCLSQQALGTAEQLAAFNQLLRGALKPLSKQLTKPEFESKLRKKLTPESKLVWEQIRGVLDADTEKIVADKPVEQNTLLALVFDALTLSLGLALLMHSIPPDHITDVLICKENALRTKKKSKKAASESEPRWQEVLTDLLLQLQLQTSSFWREFVNSIFKLLLPQMGKVNLAQMLDMLDVTKNPLGKDGEPDTDDEEAEEEQEEENEEAKMDVDSDSDDDEEVTDDSDGEDGEDNEATALALRRENVRLALLADDNEDNDASSVDWNDVTEEQGERLNLALETAFQAFKPKTGQGKSKSKRQTKSERINTTALMHFRIRVLDMLDTFVTNNQAADMEMRLDALLRVFELYMTCWQSDGKRKALSKRCDNLICKLIKNKPADTGALDKTLVVHSLEEFLKMKPKNNRLLIRVIVHLFHNFEQKDLDSEDVDTLLQQYLSRGDFEQIFNLISGNWNGIPHVVIRIGKMMCETGRWKRHKRSLVLGLLATLGNHIKSSMDKDSLEQLKALMSEYKLESKDERRNMQSLLARLN